MFDKQNAPPAPLLYGFLSKCHPIFGNTNTILCGTSKLSPESASVVNPKVLVLDLTSLSVGHGSPSQELDQIGDSDLGWQVELYGVQSLFRRVFASLQGC